MLECKFTVEFAGLGRRGLGLAVFDEVGADEQARAQDIPDDFILLCQVSEARRTGIAAAPLKRLRPQHILPRPAAPERHVHRQGWRLEPYGENRPAEDTHPEQDVRAIEPKNPGRAG